MNDINENGNQLNNVYIGIMSGTSLDGIDIVATTFHPSFEIIASNSYDMPPAIKTLILELCVSGIDEIEKLGHLDICLGKLFADCCIKFQNNYKSNFEGRSITAIGLHGQTIRHRPNNGRNQNFTLQIGDPNVVSEDTGLLTVADFRRRDMAAGGQGAPLVPAFHQSIFHSTLTNRVIINIGGMSNITLLSHSKKEPLLGFDTGPGNVLLDAWIHQQKGLNYDKNGEWGKSGKIHSKLLNQLLSLDFFYQPVPKSTGREQFNIEWLTQNIDLLATTILDTDVQATLTELTASTIANDIKKQGYQYAEMYVCGGGAYNQYLMERLNFHLPDATLVATTSELNLSPDWVEAAAFAWLAKQTLAGLSSNSPTVTGAIGPRILGAIYQA